jgi:peptide methionine sulfoxide reductase msrA/msrB
MKISRIFRILNVIVWLLAPLEGWITPFHLNNRRSQGLLSRSSRYFALVNPTTGLTSHQQQQQQRRRQSSSNSENFALGAVRVVNAGLFGEVADDLRPALEEALEREGWNAKEKDVGKMDVLYRWNQKAGMLQLVDYTQRGPKNPPRWIKVEKEGEPDKGKNWYDSERMKAVMERAPQKPNENYRPKWGDDDHMSGNLEPKRSALGYSLTPLTFEEVISRAKYLNSDQSVQVLLLGGTDPPGKKVTHNDIDLSESIQNIPDGIFVCCLSGLPIFATSDLSPLTMKSGWLIFGRPISPDHVILVESDEGAVDPRMEVLCAKSKCHLGHYSAKDGFCVSASALDLRETAMMDPDGDGFNARGSAPARAWKLPDDYDAHKTPIPMDPPAQDEEDSYSPKWGEDESLIRHEVRRSALGYSLTPMSFEDVISRAKTLNSNLSVNVLLQGKTEPHGRKLTHNGFDVSGPVNDVPEGVFTCAISGLPIFTASDLDIATSGSGWLIFRRPISPDHVLLVEPDREDSRDPHMEVLDAKSKCHLGHYFGKQGYCVNACALNFLPVEQAAAAGDLSTDDFYLSSLVSYRSLESSQDNVEQSGASMHSLQVLRDIVSTRTVTKTVVLCGGPFQEMEAALRRLPGVVKTVVGYAGGTTPNPTYDDVSRGESGHAEAVLVEFDPTVLEPHVLIQCFMALHDPAKIRAYGKRSVDTGQHRSCIVLADRDSKFVIAIRKALEEHAKKLGQDLSTTLYEMDGSNGKRWFWPAEVQFQSFDDPLGPGGLDGSATLSIPEWLDEYARR